jgi:Txe/YoeB family toxin of Txe-Axe toxin-antitoxin module
MQWKMSKLTFSEKAWDEYLFWQTNDKKILKKINTLLKDIERGGNLDGIGKPEALKDNLLDITADELTIVIGLFIAKKETL